MMKMTWEDRHARALDPHTSHEAADITAKKLSMLARLEQVYEQAWPEGLTADEAGALAGYTATDGYWKRVSDLTVYYGVLEPTGTVRPGTSGRDQRVLVWVAPEKRPPKSAPPSPPPSPSPDDALLDDLRERIRAAQAQGYTKVTVSSLARLLGIGEDQDRKEV
jgi:hypothetical protein